MADSLSGPHMSIQALERQSALMRCDIIQMIQQAGQGHPGGSLSAADILAALYFRVMRIDPTRPDWPDRDRFVLSKGHACPALYAALIRRGYLGVECRDTLRCLDSRLQGHPDMSKTPGVDMTAGSLGHGLSAGLGMALAARVTGRDYRTWVLIGDGETQEGSIWEAALVAPNLHLSNLPVVAKWQAFGWEVSEIDGHNMKQVVGALEASREATDRPRMIVAHTVKGKGVSFMENNPFWHGNAPSAEQAEVACAEVRAAAGLAEGDDGY
jgi:transketolase